MNTRISNISKIIFLNSLILFLCLILIEIILKIRKREPLLIIQKYPVPGLVCNIKIKHDVSSLYGDSKNLFSLNERDRNCYRSNSANERIPKILVLGGSTTAQTFVSEGETFQDILDSKFKNKIDFVNGGVDGQSTVGHLHAIKFWHSKALDKTKIKEILFYIGLNDHKYYLNRDNLEVNYTRLDSLNHFLIKNSRFYYFTKRFIQSLISKEVYVNHKPNPNVERFLDSEKIIKLDPDLIDKNYEEHIFEFISQSFKFFPFSTIRIIQQQVPGCKFLSKYEVIERHNKGTLVKPGSCESLGYTYLQMDRAISKLPLKLKSKISSIEKMYLEPIIKDNDVYDSVHTNKEGSRKVAEYIEKLYK